MVFSDRNLQPTSCSVQAHGESQLDDAVPTARENCSGRHDTGGLAIVHFNFLSVALPVQYVLYTIVRETHGELKKRPVSTIR